MYIRSVERPAFILHIFWHSLSASLWIGSVPSSPFCMWVSLSLLLSFKFLLVFNIRVRLGCLYYSSICQTAAAALAASTTTATATPSCCPPLPPQLINHDGRFLSSHHAIGISRVRCRNLSSVSLQHRPWCFMFSGVNRDYCKRKQCGIICNV